MTSVSFRLLRVTLLRQTNFSNCNYRFLAAFLLAGFLATFRLAGARFAAFLATFFFAIGVKITRHVIMTLFSL